MSIDLATKQRLYQTEKQVYIRLGEVGIDEIEGFSVPTMLQFDDQLWVVEMEIVKPPFILDFAGAYLDQKPPYFYDDEMMAEWQADKQDIFGERWATVKGILASFRRHGIYLADVKFGNIEFEQE